MMVYTITAQIEVDDATLPDGGAAPTLEIDYRWSPGRPSYIPPGEYAAIDPPDPAEVDFVAARVTDADGIGTYLDEPDPERHSWRRSDTIANNWLNSREGFRTACHEAEDANQPDPDYLLDLARDREWDRF